MMQTKQPTKTAPSRASKLWLVEDKHDQQKEIARIVKNYFARLGRKLEFCCFADEWSFRMKVEQLRDVKLAAEEWPSVVISDVMLPFVSEDEATAQWVLSLKIKDPELLESLLKDKDAYKRAGTRNWDFLRRQEKDMHRQRLTPFIYYTICEEGDFPLTGHKDRRTSLINKSAATAELCGAIASYLAEDVGLVTEWPEGGGVESRRLRLQGPMHSKLRKGLKTPLSDTIPLKR